MAIDSRGERMSALAKIILAHRYLYFVLTEPVISDAEYDQLEKSLSPEERESLGVGSSLESSYSDEIKALAASIQKRR
jgi:NAD-dependent DNA ligase